MSREPSEVIGITVNCDGATRTSGREPRSGSCQRLNGPTTRRLRDDEGIDPFE